MSLIDAEWLEKQAVCIYTYGGTRFVSVDTIKKAPTIEAEPVRSGRWVNAAGGRTICKHCGEYPLYDYHGRQKFSRYCPNCGAKMDLEG